MRAISKEELEAAIAHRSPGERISFREVEIWNMDLTGTDLSNMEFELSSFQNTVLDHVNLENSSVENALFDGCSLHGANFANANLKTASFRYCDLRESNIEGANLFGAVLEYAKLDGIVSNEDTKWFRRQGLFSVIRNVSTIGWCSFSSRRMPRERAQHFHLAAVTRRKF